MTFTTFPSPLVVATHGPSERIDLYLIKHGICLSRSRLQRLIDEAAICVNGQPTKASYRVKNGDQIEICIPRPTPLEILPQEIPLTVLFEDEVLLVLDKPAGMVSHPAPGHHDNTLVNALLHHCRGLTSIGGRERPGLVHRLDKETSGVMVVAKTDQAHQYLSMQFKEHSIDRRYLALVCGEVEKRKGVVVLPIGRDKNDRKKISSRTTHPREATTRFVVKERFPMATLLSVYPETGRTHQIRVHLSHLGYPIVGDKVYGGKLARSFELPASRQMLHAEHLGFIHPIREEKMAFSSPPPLDMQSVLDQLRVIAKSVHGA